MVALNEDKLSFKGRDRRLFFNKALCELQMGHFDSAIATCRAYLDPIIKEKNSIQKQNDPVRMNSISTVQGEKLQSPDTELNSDFVLSSHVPSPPLSPDSAFA